VSRPWTTRAAPPTGVSSRTPDVPQSAMTRRRETFIEVQRAWLRAAAPAGVAAVIQTLLDANTRLAIAIDTLLDGRASVESAIHTLWIGCTTLWIGCTTLWIGCTTLEDGCTTLLNAIATLDDGCTTLLIAIATLLIAIATLLIAFASLLIAFASLLNAIATLVGWPAYDDSRHAHIVLLIFRQIAFSQGIRR
jgi:hypothetical protein